MQRRDFIAGIAGATTWPFAARAQQPGRMRPVGTLFGGVGNPPIFRCRRQPSSCSQ